MLCREIWLPLSFTAAAGALSWVQAGPEWSAPAWVLGAYLVYLYRDPVRPAPPDPLDVVCPMDGVVERVGARRDVWLRRDALAVRVRSYPPGVSPLRSPAEGKLEDLRVRGGWSALLPARMLSPTHYALWIRTDEGDDVVVVIQGRRLVSRLKLAVSPGERIGRGRRLGFVYFATAVEVLLPSASLARVCVGAPGRAGSGSLATLVHSTSGRSATG